MQPITDKSKQRVLPASVLIVSWEATAEALMILVAAFVVGIGGGVVQCYEYTKCHEARLCSNASRFRPLEMSCSFVNYVSVSGDVLYGNGNASSTHMSLTRSVCAPGERLHTNSITGAGECAPWRSWPNALNAEIMDTDATSVHDQMCGAWIEAGPTVAETVSYWSFYDSVNADHAVLNADKAVYSSVRLSATDLGKFFASCQHTILGGSGAIRASGKEAYAYLKTGLTGLTTEKRILEAAGWLAGHHCDGPVQIGVTVDEIFKATSYRGSYFDEGALAEALYAVDEPSLLQELAETGNTLVNNNAWSSPPTTFEQIENVFEGATGRTDHATVPLMYTVTPELDGLTWMATQPRYAEAKGYLHGLAAMCAFALQGSLDMHSAGEWSARSRSLRRMQQTKAPAVALGRLSNGPNAVPLTADPTNETLAQATTVTFSQLRAEPVGDAREDCPALAAFLFPDRLDEEHFSLMITDHLYERIHEVAEVLRDAVVHVVQNNPAISAVLEDPATVATSVQNTLVRIAGAPRGTWAAIQRDFADGNLDSTDGPMLMALKQSKAIFTDRINILFDNANLCSGPPVYDALEANAYIYPSGGCTHIMLGVLRKPFADERYNNASLASRVGYIMAHELGHNTINTAWNATNLAVLLHRYTSNLYSEALADLVSALAIIHAGLATSLEVCEHISQLWCARVPLGYTHSTHAAHPGPNERGDLLCETLSDLGLL